MKNYSKLLNLIKCLDCNNELKFFDQNFICTKCENVYPIINGIPRFVDKKFFKLNDDNINIENKTKNYFGYEWDYFKRWGFIDDNLINKYNGEYSGGTVNDRKKAFKYKCRLDSSELNNKIVLDCGCGNGRYTYEARLKGNDNSLIIGLDIGYGSVKSAYENTREFDNILIIQCSLFNLPFKDNVIDSAFSNGVLMHTGNAQKVFNEISRTIKRNGVFVAHLYGKLNPIWEFNDYWIRKITTKLSIEKGIKLAKILTKLSRVINKFPRGFDIANLFFRIQPSVIHMFDWYCAPIATHHTYIELSNWYKKNNFKILDNLYDKKQQQKNFFKRPWAINLKGKKQ